MATDNHETIIFLEDKLEGIHRERENAYRLRIALQHQLREADRNVATLDDMERRVSGWLADLKPRSSEQAEVLPAMSDWTHPATQRADKTVTELAEEFLAEHRGEFSSDQLWRFLVARQPKLRRETMLSYLSRYTKSGFLARIEQGRYIKAEQESATSAGAEERLNVGAKLMVDLAEGVNAAAEHIIDAELINARPLPTPGMSMNRVLSHKRSAHVNGVEPVIVGSYPFKKR